MNLPNQRAFANALAALTAALYVLFAIIALVSPSAFQFLFNAQFFGADVASLLPKVGSSVVSLVTLVIVVGMAWVMGSRGLAVQSVRKDGVNADEATVNRKRPAPLRSP